MIFISVKLFNNDIDDRGNMHDVNVRIKLNVWIFCMNYLKWMNREKGNKLAYNSTINWPNPSNNDIAFFVCKHFLTDKAHYRKIDFLLTFIHTICRINFSIVLVLYILIPLILYAERSHDMVASYYEWNKKETIYIWTLSRTEFISSDKILKMKLLLV